MGMKYSDLVDYDKLDPYKEECIRRFQKTLSYPNRLGVRIVPESIGETAVAIDADFFSDFYLAFGVEGLGTKNMIAESKAEKIKILRNIIREFGINLAVDIGINTRKLFSGIGQDGMAMSINDLNAIGALAIAYEPIVATGSSDYLTEINVRDGLIDGFEKGAYIAQVAIPGGETPTLPGIVYPNTIDLAGGSLGLIRPKSRLCLGDRLTEGLTIYGVVSSGIQSNGVSLARKIAEKSKQGYFTRLPSGKTIGEALLTPTTIYSPLVEALANEGADIVYMQPITGHGFGKIMRKKKDLTYVIEYVPEPQEEFRFMQEVGPVDDEEAYRVWNMGIGWVLFAHSNESSKINRACKKSDHQLYELGPIQKGERQVVIPSKNIVYRPK